MLGAIKRLRTLFPFAQKWTETGAPGVPGRSVRSRAGAVYVTGHVRVMILSRSMTVRSARADIRRERRRKRATRTSVPVSPSQGIAFWWPLT